MTSSINVVVAKKLPIRVSTNATSTAVVSSNPVTVKPDTNFTVLSGGAAELDQLTDVDASLEEDGSVLQYNADTKTYQIKPLIMDGGEF